MDGTASTLTLIGVAIKIADNLHKVFIRLKNSPTEIIALFDEVQSIRIVLSDIREKENVLSPWLDLSALAILLRRAQNDLEETNRYLSGFISQNAKEELAFNRLGWYRKRDTALKLHVKLESIRNNAVAILTCANLLAPSFQRLPQDRCLRTIVLPTCTLRSLFEISRLLSTRKGSPTTNFSTRSSNSSPPRLRGSWL
jgi:hypothetical protein